MFNIHNTTAYIRIICFICWFVWFNLVLVCLFAVVAMARRGENVWELLCSSLLRVCHLKSSFVVIFACTLYTETSHYILLKELWIVLGRTEMLRIFFISIRYLHRLNHRKSHIKHNDYAPNTRTHTSKSFRIS